MSSEVRLHSSQQHSCCYSHTPSKRAPILLALGVITLLGGVCLVLSAHQVLFGENLVSKLGTWGFALGYSVAAVGLSLMVCSLYLSCNRKESGDSISSVEPTSRSTTHTATPKTLEQQIKIVAKKADRRVLTTGWKRGLGHDEVKQTLGAFETSDAHKLNIPRNRLNILVLDNGISAQEQKFLQIIADYLATLNGIEVNVIINTDALTSENKRGKQYDARANLIQLATNLPKNEFVIGFTSHDLYPSGEKVNFIFGVGIWQLAAGLFSVHRCRAWDDKITLVRLMKLASHEFGHMRGLEHCTEYSCCMQGVSSVDETDAGPLTFCAEDMAKLCLLNGWELKEGYQRQLDFFKNFENKHSIRIDFSKEIRHLTKKIQAC